MDKIRKMKLRHKIGELITKSGLSYSQFGRKAGIGMRTAKELYNNPYYLLETPTLMKCAQFFGVEPGELVVDEDLEVGAKKLSQPSNQTDPSLVQTDSSNKADLIFPASPQEENQRVNAPAHQVKTPSDSELLTKFLTLIFPDSLLEQVKRAAPTSLLTFIYEAIAEKLEREQTRLHQQSTAQEFRNSLLLTNS